MLYDVKLIRDRGWSLCIHKYEDSRSQACPGTNNTWMSCLGNCLLPNPENPGIYTLCTWCWWLTDKGYKALFLALRWGNVGSGHNKTLPETTVFLAYSTSSLLCRVLLRTTPSLSHMCLNLSPVSRKLDLSNSWTSWILWEYLNKVILHKCP